MQIKINKALLFISCILPCIITSNTLAETKVIYPLQKISALDCRFQKYSELSDACKIDLPILRTSDYKKYLKEDGWYNLYTRIYTVLWGSSYKYGWDVWNGWHEWTDIATAEWTPVYAIADGKVIVADKLLGRWNVVSIEHEINGKTVVSNYAHLSKIEVESGDKVTVGTKIWEVGSTGNSFGNHLHFQIDLKYKFHPYYYDYSECPYSYSKITESDICTKFLEQHTIDPLLFLETQGGVLDMIEIKTEKINPTDLKQSTPTEDDNGSNDIDIFNITVYRDSSSDYIKKVQKVFRDIGIYKWGLTGDYADIEDDILAYQISRKIISSASDTWAGYWGPKTRAQVKDEYENFSLPAVATKLSDTQDTVIRDFSKTVEKIDRTNILTREQIEEREVDDFLKSYNVNISTDTIGGNIKVGETKILGLNITDARGRGFKWSLPWELSFSVDTSLVEVFPKKLYYFTDGKRDIKITALKSGSTTLRMRIGQKVVKSIPINIYGEGTKIEPTTGKFVANSKVVVWENKTWTFRFKDKSGRDIVNLKFDWNYRLTSNENVLFCVKKGNIKDIEKIYKKTCKKEDYINMYDFTYTDTVGWVLVFDYIIAGKGAKITLSNLDKKTDLGSKTIATELPKGLKKDYDYYKDVVTLLQSGVVWWISQWYFQQENALKEKDAKDWMINTLRYMKKNTKDDNFRKKINARLEKLKPEQVSDFNTLTREAFLKKAYEYLIFNEGKSVTIEYKDLDSDLNKKANEVFDKNTTWKDQFGKTYYRPEKSITRGEAAYFIATLLQKDTLPLVTTIR
jgi:Peptidase family M23